MSASHAMFSSAALTARHHGVDVLMVEKEPLFGSTTCYSAGRHLAGEI